MDPATLEMFLKCVCEGFDKLYNTESKIFLSEDEDLFWIDIFSTDFIEPATGQPYTQGHELSFDDVNYMIEEQVTFATIQPHYQNFVARVAFRRNLQNARVERAERGQAG